MAFRNMKRHPLSFIIKEMHIKTTLRPLFLPNKLAKVKIFENIILVKTQKKSHIAGGSIDQNNLIIFT